MTTSAENNGNNASTVLSVTANGSVNAITYAKDDANVTMPVTTINGNLAPPPQRV
jgi:hypothetical protein